MCLQLFLFSIFIKKTAKVQLLNKVNSNCSEIIQLSKLNADRKVCLDSVIKLLQNLHPLVINIEMECTKVLAMESHADIAKFAKELEHLSGELKSLIAEELKIDDIDSRLSKIDDFKDLVREKIFGSFSSRYTQKRKGIIYRISKQVSIILLAAHALGIGTSVYFSNYPAPWMTNKDYTTESGFDFSQSGMTQQGINFTTDDNISLNGMLFMNPKADKDKVVIVLHEFSFNKTHMMPSVQEYGKKYNVFIYDARGHGMNSSHHSGIGFDERLDLKAALDSLAKLGFKEAIVHGVSMGGATAVFTASEYSSSLISIKGIIIQGTYATQDFAIDSYAKIYHMPWTMSAPSKIITGLERGQSLKDISPANILKKVNVSVLVIHEYEDPYMPFSQALEIQKAAGAKHNVEFFFIHGNQHYNHSQHVISKAMDFFGRNF